MDDRVGVDMTDASASARRGNGVEGARLRAFVERVERLREDKKALSDDEGQVFAEAKADGYTPKYIRAIVKLRTLKPSERQENEAMMDLYLSALGMAAEPPLFRAVQGVDRAARAQLVEALKLLAPDDGEIIVKAGGAPLRIWRDKDGEAHADDWVEPKPPATPTGAKPSGGGRPAPERPPAPDVDDAGADALGFAAAKDDKPVIGNPFPWDDRRRAIWDAGWRRGAGNDGMGPSEDK